MRSKKSVRTVRSLRKQEAWRGKLARQVKDMRAGRANILSSPTLFPCTFNTRISSLKCSKCYFSTSVDVGINGIILNTNYVVKLCSCYNGRKRDWRVLEAKWSLASFYCAYYSYMIHVIQPTWTSAQLQPMYDSIPWWLAGAGRRAW
jgi:hypothetical protein